jgi:hypothetical protein
MQPSEAVLGDEARQRHGRAGHQVRHGWGACRWRGLPAPRAFMSVQPGTQVGLVDQGVEPLHGGALVGGREDLAELVTQLLGCDDVVVVERPRHREPVADEECLQLGGRGQALVTPPRRSLCW